MNVNQVTAKIGQAFASEQSVLDPLIKQPKIKLKDGEAGYIVKLSFDMTKEEITFTLQDRWLEEYAREYNYFGNNAAAGFQYYIVREVNSLHYLLSAAFSDLFLILQKHGLQNGQLGTFLQALADKGFLQLAEKKGQGRINLNKFTGLLDGQVRLVDKKIQLNDKEYGHETFVKAMLGEEKMKEKIALVVPEIIDGNGNSHIFSQLKDYEVVVIKENNLGISEEKESSNSSSKRICHLCGSLKEDVSSSYSAKFSRSGINKIFTTTTINSSGFNQKFDHDDRYGICKACYNHLLSGEKIVSQNFASRIANEPVFIIPEGLMKDFNYDEVQRIQEEIDQAFKPKEALKWFRGLDNVHGDELKGYSMNLIFYRSDGNSLSVTETIEDVPVYRLVEISEVIEKVKEEAALKGAAAEFFSLARIYWIVPVRTNKKREQLDIKRVLSLYDAILSGYSIDVNTIFQYFTEALDRGTKQLEKAQMDNYQNLNLIKYKSFGDRGLDQFVKDTAKNYLLLLKTLERLHLIQPIFTGEGLETMNKLVTASEKVNRAFEEMEEYLVRQKFSDEAKALFYLGAMINRVGIAQYNKGHRKKPILKKIQFLGMKNREIQRLYEDVCEKLIQYEKMDLFAEALLNRLHEYCGKSFMEEWSLNEHINVFYIMSGYSYSSGNWGKIGETDNLEGLDFDKEEEAKENDQAE